MREYVCPICGKKFIQNNPTNYLYRTCAKKGSKLLCSYTCWRKATKDDVHLKSVRGYRK